MIKDMHILAKKHNGKCLSKYYKNNRTKLIWQCSEGHIWRTKPSSIKSGSWCKKCSFDYDKMNFHRKYSFNENLLDDINKQEAAYILGIFCADGYISNRDKVKKYKCCISLQKKDKEILNKIVKAFNIIPDPLKYRPKLKKWSLSLSSKHLWNQFNQLGCTTRKTFTLKFPNLSEKATRHFFRGYFDGDGCIYIRKRNSSYSYRVDLISSNSFCNKAKSYLKKKLKLKIYSTHPLANAPTIINPTNGIRWIEMRLDKYHDNYLLLTFLYIPLYGY